MTDERSRKYYVPPTSIHDNLARERQPMSHPPHPIDFSHLSPAERILLAEDLWDSVTAEQDAPSLTPAQQEELQRRLAAADRGEMSYSAWPDVKHRLLHPK